MLGGLLAAIGLSVDLMYALAAGSLGGLIRGNAAVARRRGRMAGGVYLALAAVTLAGGRRVVVSPTLRGSLLATLALAASARSSPPPTRSRAIRSPRASSCAT